MQRQSEIYLEALGANIELTAQMKHELDTLGYTVVHNVADPDLAHPDEIVFAAPVGSVMIYNAHTWHGGTQNRIGIRRRVLHALYIDRADTAQQDQRRMCPLKSSVSTGSARQLSFIVALMLP
ncbi:hypothetical protein KAJ71_03880 [Serratia sp. arafor3]|uniref:Phytanoyl-CoA dioxygenase n=1 Tax=Serratia silvae TaxID=2824122 RepID=A0ABT0K9F8_9GAMM|nr:hypothetical protein [Serratia silvae]MCL1028183.1 hypothetical protein [Serratia silvae]